MVTFLGGHGHTSIRPWLDKKKSGRARLRGAEAQPAAGQLRARGQQNAAAAMTGASGKARAGRLTATGIQNPPDDLLLLLCEVA